MITGQTYEPVEIVFKSAVLYTDPFNEVALDVIVEDHCGAVWKVPAFWSGEQIWKARIRAPHVGKYTYKSESTNSADTGLHGQVGEIEISEYMGNNPFYIHGSVRVSNNGRYFEHEDGTPFVYFGDTWHPLMTSRLNNSDEVELLAQDREKKGFTIIEFINGFYCDVTLWDKRLCNEAGFAWTEELKSINPDYYNISEPKVACIIKHNMALCINTAWGFYMKYLGLKKMKKHIRYMVARWGAYPVFWTLAGETSGKPYSKFLSNPGEGSSRDADDDWYTEEKAKEMWSDALAYLKEIDPYNSPTMTHVMPGNISSDEVNNPELLDYNMMQAAFHTELYDVISKDIKTCAKKGYIEKPVRPIVNQECCYEQMLNQCGPHVQRWIFWHSILRGCAGTMYGANGIFNMSHQDQPFGIPCYELNWGDWSWQEAYQFEGCKQVSDSRRYLNNFEWWRLQPAFDKVVNIEKIDNWQERVAAEIPGELLIGYYQPFVSMDALFARAITGITFKNLTCGDQYYVVLYDPIRNREYDQGQHAVAEDGTLTTPEPPAYHDWVYVAKKVK